MKKCVLHICNYAAAYRGNFISSLLRLEETLNKNDIHQIYFLPSRAYKTSAVNWINELKNEGHEIYILSDSVKENLALFSRIKKENNIIKVFRHFSNNKADFYTKLFFKGKDTIYFFHSEYKTPENSLKHILRKILYKDYLLVGVSEAVSERVKKVFPKNKTIAISNAIEFKRLDSPDKMDFGEGISLMTMGYNPIIKGCDLAIKAVEKLHEKYNLKLYIVAASHSDEVNKLIDDLLGSKPDWIEILPPMENISTYLSNVDIFLAPSRSEGLPFACVEATYCLANIVLSDIGAHRLLKINHRYLFESENPDDFVVKLEEAINNLDSENTIIEKEHFKNEVIKEYDLDAWCQKVIKAIG